MKDLFTIDDPSNTGEENIKPNQRKLRSSSLKCSSCGSEGHISLQCYINIKKCIFCLSTEHSYSKCSEVFCHVCNLPGHLAKNCSSAIRCPTCKMGGHKSSECIIRPGPCKIQETSVLKCIVCNKTGHVNCESPLGNDLVSRATCYRCGFTGHSAQDCPQSKQEKAELFKLHVKEALRALPVISDQMNFREKRYWKKIENKAFKKLMKKQKKKKSAQQNKKKSSNY